jgi:hypothetical protein
MEAVQLGWITVTFGILFLCFKKLEETAAVESVQLDNGGGRFIRPVIANVSRSLLRSRRNSG